MTSIHLIERIEALLANKALTKSERSKQLWQTALEFWHTVFPVDAAPEEISVLWKEVIAENNLEEKKDGNLIIDILSWPATGQEPKYD